MPTVLIFGGSGKVAKHLTKKLVSASYTVHSIIRNPDQSPEIENLGAIPIVQSLEASSVDDLTATLRRVGPAVVVFAAGAGGGDASRTKSVDHEGAVKTFDAASRAGVKRYIIVSALDVRDVKKALPEWYDEADRSMSTRVWKAIGPYLEAKLAADTDLVSNNSRRGLDYTIVRPGGLSVEPGKGTVSAGKVHISTTVSREDVAEVVKQCIENPATGGLVFDVVGGETAIAEAVRDVATHRIDTFAGYY